MTFSSQLLGPTASGLLEDSTRPYFLWWSECTVAELRQHLASSDAEERAYWLGALLREANSRDVWIFTSPTKIRADWPQLARYLGRNRPMWKWLLRIDDSPQLAAAEL